MSQLHMMMPKTKYCISGMIIWTIVCVAIASDDAKDKKLHLWNDQTLLSLVTVHDISSK